MRMRARWRNDPSPMSMEDFARRARRRLPSMVRAYVDGGADAEATMAANTADFGRWRLRQRVLGGTSDVDLRTTVAGTPLALPVLLAPTGLAGAAHWHGDVGAARAAEGAGTRLVVSSAATYTLEEVARATTTPHWFQLYPWRDRQLTGSLVARARAAGFTTLVVTVDVPVYRNRLAERRLGMAVPPTLTPATVAHALTRPAWCYGYLRHGRTTLANLDAERPEDRGDGLDSFRVQSENLVAGLSWDDLAWLRETWAGPLLVKGVLDPEDASRIADLGADGVVVSNHGGRQLDRTLSGIAALPAVADAVGDRIEVLVDGGVRSAEDVVIALALGARAVLVGRPVMWALAAGGERGVAAMLEMLHTDLARTLTMMGVRRATDLAADHLVRPDGAPARS